MTEHLVALRLFLGGGRARRRRGSARRTAFGVQCSSAHFRPAAPILAKSTAPACSLAASASTLALSNAIGT